MPCALRPSPLALPFAVLLSVGVDRADWRTVQVGRLRKSVDKEAADRLREEAVERIASKGSRRSDPESEPQKK